MSLDCRKAITLVMLVITAALAAAQGTVPQSSEHGHPAKTFANSCTSSDIGAPRQRGSHRLSMQGVTVLGAGAGLDVRGGDQVHFVSVTRPTGDFEISARLDDPAVAGDGSAGLMARSSNDPESVMCAIYFTPSKCSLTIKARVPGTAAGSRPRVITNGIELAHRSGEPAVSTRRPLWLRIVRIGLNFAAYKSRDGHVWLPVSNNSGGPASFKGPIEIGIFASNPSSSATSTARFSSVQIGAAAMRYRSSCVGNSFGCRDADNHVSNGLSAMWVAPDGSCYTSSYWDEGGQPCTSYKTGRVTRPLPIGTPQTAEGGITGDDKYIYVASVDQIIRLDPAAPDFAPFPMPLSFTLLDKKLNQCVVSGMASNGKELYIADSRENRILVESTETAKTFQVAMAANDGIAIAPGKVLVPAGPGYAPQEVYQSQRIGEGVRYTPPGFIPGEVYTVRFHMAEYVERPANADPRNRYNYVSINHPVQGAVNHIDIDPVKLSGGVMRACFKDLPGCRADEKGNVSLGIGSYGGPGICGIEILDGSGKRNMAINCGGIPVGEFLGESQELPNKSFSFDRPGPMVFDRRGDLWIIQRGNDLPIGIGLTAKYPASVKCCRTDGSFTGREIKDVINPRALAYDSRSDTLLVGENGSNLNVRIYSALDTTPKLNRELGVRGGIFAGAHPGAVIDPAAGGEARFAGISGLGLDAGGNVYVGGGFQGTDLRSFSPTGKLLWRLNSLMFCNTYDADPESDGTELYGTYNHVHMDYSKTAPGTEQTYTGYMWDLRRLGDPDRASNSQAIVRRVGPRKQPVMFTTGQGDVSDIKLFRISGELAIPAGGICQSGAAIWIDRNGDGIMQPNEIEKMASPLNPTGLTVDSHGDMWAVVTATDGSYLRHFKLHSVNTSGVPVYGGTIGQDYEDVRLPEEGAKTNGWGMASRIDYDRDRDILIAFFPRVPRTGENDHSTPEYLMARYDNWSKGNRNSRWKVRMLRPESDPDWFMYEVNLFPYSGYMGMQLVGDYIFFAYLFGEVHVFDLKSGKIVEVFSAGPEINGQTAWEDASMGLRAFKTKSGEYIVLTENSGWGGKDNMYRWRPK